MLLEIRVTLVRGRGKNDGTIHARRNTERHVGRSTRPADIEQWLRFTADKLVASGQTRSQRIRVSSAGRYLVLRQWLDGQSVEFSRYR